MDLSKAKGARTLGVSFLSCGPFVRKAVRWREQASAGRREIATKAQRHQAEDADRPSLLRAFVPLWQSFRMKICRPAWADGG